MQICTKVENQNTGQLMPDFRDVNESELIAEIYDAALHPELWWNLMRKIRTAADAAQCNLIFYDLANPKRNQIYFGGYYPDDIVSRYYDDIIHFDYQQALAVHGTMADGEMADRWAHKHSLNADFKKFYTEDIKEGAQLGARLFKSNHSSAFFSTSRLIGDKSFDENTNDFLSRISSHLCRAMRIYHQLNSTRHDHLKLQQVLQKTAAALALLDDDGHIVIANEEAARILSHHPALRIGSNGRIQATSKTVDAALQKLIAQMLSAQLDASILQTTEPTMPISHPDCLHPLKLSVVPLKRPSVGNTANDNAAPIAIFITDPERRWHVSEDYLHHAYELTPAEYTVTQLMINGANTQSVAEQRGTTETTARWQLKRIMEKTATHSQAQLMQLLISLSSDFAIPVS